MSKPISEWSFEDKYDKLGEMEKMLHQVRLIRADIGTVAYILLSIIAYEVIGDINKEIGIALVILILGYGYFKHSEVRTRLYNKFEHQGAYI